MFLVKLSFVFAVAFFAAVQGGERSTADVLADNLHYFLFNTSYVVANNIETLTWSNNFWLNYTDGLIYRNIERSRQKLDNKIDEVELQGINSTDLLNCTSFVEYLFNATFLNVTVSARHCNHSYADDLNQLLKDIDGAQRNLTEVTNLGIAAFNNCTTEECRNSTGFEALANQQTAIDAVMVPFNEFKDLIPAAMSIFVECAAAHVDEGTALVEEQTDLAIGCINNLVGNHTNITNFEMLSL